MDENYTEFLGIMYGDGCLSSTHPPSSRWRSYIVYVSSCFSTDLEHLNHISYLFSEIFNKDTKIRKRNDSDVAVISFNDKKIFDEIESIGFPVGKKYGSMKVPERIKKNPKLFSSFIRGVFDTDGCVVVSRQHRKERYYPRIEITSKSRSFLEEMFGFLISNGFYGSISDKSGCWRLEIPGFKNTRRWIKLIGSSNPKHINKLKRFRNPSDDGKPDNSL